MRSIRKRTRRPLAPCIGFYQRGSLPDGGVKCSSCRPARVKSCPTFSLREKKTSPRPFAPFRPLSIFRSKSEFSPSMAYQSRQPLSTLNPTKRPPWRISPVDPPKFTILDRRLGRREGASSAQYILAVNRRGWYAAVGTRHTLFVRGWKSWLFVEG